MLFTATQLDDAYAWLCQRRLFPANADVWQLTTNWPSFGAASGRESTDPSTGLDGRDRVVVSWIEGLLALKLADNPG